MCHCQSLKNDDKVHFLVEIDQIKYKRKYVLSIEWLLNNLFYLWNAVIAVYVHLLPFYFFIDLCYIIYIEFFEPFY